MAQTQEPAQMYSDGGTIDYTPVSQVYGGDVVVVGTIPMVATVDIAAGEQGALKYNDIFKLPKTSDAFTQGDAVYWNATGNPVGGTAGTGAADSTTGQLAGFAVADAASGDEYVICALTAAKRTTTIAGSVTADDITGSDSSLGISGQSAAQGGAILLTGGTSSTSGNAGGAITLTGGTPGATGVGGAVTITAGAGGSTSGAGGAVTIAAGAGTAGNANGGALTIRAGAKQGSGADGALSIGTTNTASITIGAASIETKIVGPENRTVGASTAAAGTTFADAGALPAGTAAVYPTTGADGTKGVIVNASDKVTGRMIFIGNGVSNQILKVYGPSGATINGASANVAFSGASGKGVIMYCLDSTANTWLAW